MTLQDMSIDDLLNFHNSEKIIVQLSKLLKEDNKHIGAHMLLSRINFLKGNLKVALEGFKYALSLDPQNTLAYYDLGVCEFHVAHITAAITAFETVLKMEKNFTMAKYWLGKCYRSQFMYNELIVTYTDLINQYPEWAGVASDLGLAHEAVGNVQEAIKYFEKVTRISKYNLIAYYRLGVIYEKSGETQKAIDIFKKGLKINPDSKLIQDRLDHIINVDMP